MLLTFLIVAGNAEAAERLTLSGAMTQGGLLIGKVPLGTEVILRGRVQPLADDGSFLIGIGRDEVASLTLDIRYSDGTSEQQVVAVAPRSWDIQRIDGLAKRKVTPDPQDLIRIKAEKALVVEARQRANTTRQPHYASGFAWPARGRISGVYGSQRILNGQPRRPHFGTDVAAPEGAPVHAMADGVVALTHPGMFFNGKTVMLDHGLGLTSVYIHLSATQVKTGDRVKKGQRIGAIGRTGRATGPHLHWGVSLRGTPLDPALLAGPMPAPE